MKLISPFFIATMALVVTGCGSTVINSPTTGKPLLVTSADIHGLAFHVSKDGSVDLSGEFDHATPIKAQGEAMTAKWGAFLAGLAGLAIYLK